MSDWLRLDADTLNPPTDAKIRGMIVQVYWPPHDVPDALRTRFDEKAKEIIIEFRYLGEEPTNIQRCDPVVLRVGRTSGRLYAIRIPQAIAQQGGVLRLKPILLAVGKYGEANRGNSEVVLRALETREDDILQALEA